MAPAPPRFFADCMLGKLARWLRVLGYDAAYERRIEDGDLVARARAEGRILLTRDTRLLRRRALPPSLLVESQDPAAQIRQVVGAFGLRRRAGAVLSRCLVCNAATAPLPRDEARGRVPPYVHRTKRRFTLCPACGRIYWRATHVRGMTAALRAAIGASRPAAGPEGAARRPAVPGLRG